MSETLIKPYGDTLNDGKVQLSFTLPIEYGPKAQKAAEEYVAKLNFTDISVVCSKKIADQFTFFVVYGKAEPFIDIADIKVSQVTVTKMDFYQINDLIKSRINRKVNIVGATIGSDAHTVGIDAIMNMKGYNQDYGLERYPQINAYNLGAQVACEDLVKKALEYYADVILISQTVTQNESHIRNFTELIELLEAENLRDRFILIAGGARINHEFAIELGYDAGFGPGTVPSDVASYIVNKMIDKLT